MTVFDARERLRERIHAADEATGRQRRVAGAGYVGDA